MFDGGVFVGRNPSTGLNLPPSAILERLKALGTTRAIVSHYKSIYYDYREGNTDLLTVCASRPDQLFPAVSLSPHGLHPHEAQAYLRDLADRGARVLGILEQPAYYVPQLESQLIREQARIACEQGLIVQLGLSGLDRLAPALELYADLPGPVLIRWQCGRGYFNLAEIIAACDRFPNLAFDVGAVNCCDGIETLVRAVGADRLYVASNIPEGFDWSTRLLLETAQLSEQERTQIASGTLCGLLGVSETEQPAQSPPGAKWKELLELPKVDTHWHFDGWNLLDRCRDVAALRASAKAFNVRRAVFSSSRALNYDMEEGNAEVEALTNDDPDGLFFGLIVVNPLRLQASLEQMARYAGHPRFVGVKTIQDLYGYRLDHSDYEPIIQRASELGLPIMAHIPGAGVAAARHPEAQFLIAHATWQRIESLVDAQNIAFDLTTSHNDVAESQLERFVEAVGADRVVFGSDARLISPAWTLGKLASSELSLPTLRRICCESALNILPKLRHP